MQKEVDIIEDNFLKKYPKALDILLYDQTTKQNILWATNNYEHFGIGYQFSSQINTELITGSNGKLIMPRAFKNKILQKIRVKEMAEVYTPSWLCNEQINSIDDSWFNKKGVFNNQVILGDGTTIWKTNENKIKFPKDKTWKKYVNDIRLEVSCGEAPYLTSRYDTTTGKYISVKNRIGFLDRKLRVINENIKTPKSWLKYTELAYENIYGYEFQGDSLLLARESLLYTFIDNYFERFGKEPKFEAIEKIAYIISWNIWQMDGLKCVIPNSCITIVKDTNKIIECKGCKINNNYMHNGRYCTIMDWRKTNPLTNEKGQKTRFIDILQDEGGK